MCMTVDELKMLVKFATIRKMDLKDIHLDESFIRLIEILDSESDIIHKTLPIITV